jgi:C4-dicarboxylate-specific signal transduction histidine kinase
VEDRGTGIPEEVLPRIFDPFFTSREPGEGIGMGLALTARIVGELAGTIEAENRGTAAPASGSASRGSRRSEA